MPSPAPSLSRTAEKNPYVGVNEVSLPSPLSLSPSSLPPSISLCSSVDVDALLEADSDYQTLRLLLFRQLGFRFYSFRKVLQQADKRSEVEKSQLSVTTKSV